MNPRLLMLLVALGWFSCTAGAGTLQQAWVHRFDRVLTNSADAAVAAVRDPAGNLYVTGTSTIGSGQP